ncbi:hypothetical protein Tco_0486509 [Tanacetum coccineum]
MQQFWYSIKKIQGTDFYKFLLANKKCTVNADVFRTILDIYPRVKGVDFIDFPDDDTALNFLIDLGYKGPLYKHTNMFVDHMHQPWRTLAAIINKCLSGKTASNDKLRKSRIDHRKEKRLRRKTMPYPRFTKIIINHFLKQQKSLTNLNYQHYHTIKDDGIVNRLKFVRIGEDYQEYRLSIPETLLTEAIKQSESYQMFIKYSTGQICPKKSKGKGSQGKKTIDDSQETIDVSEESEPKPKLDKKKTSTNSISKTKPEEAEEARQVHATHARIVTKYVPKSAKKKSGGMSSMSVVIQDTPSAPKSKPATSKKGKDSWVYLLLTIDKIESLERESGLYHLEKERKGKYTLVRLPMDIRLKIELENQSDLMSHLPQSLFDVGSGRISIIIVNTLVSL